MSMSSTQTTEERARVSVRNIGGINEMSVELTPGTTALAGRNATNRTSFLQAIMAALGSDNVSLKGDSDEGTVELTIGDDTYTRTLTRTNNTVVTDGDPYLEDTELADLFAFLLESNEARRAVARDEDLRDLIMRPVDTEAIQAEIEQLEAEKRDLDEELEKLRSLEQQSSDLEQERTQLSNQITAKREALDDKKQDLETIDADIGEVRDEKTELKEKLNDLRETRSSLEDVRFDLDAERESIEALRDEKDELEDKREALPETPAGDTDDLNARIDQYRDEIQALDATVSELQTIIQFNRDMLEGTNPDIRSALRGDEDGAPDTGESITDQLVEDNDTVVCWTCGSEVDTRQIEATLERLQDLRQEKREKRNALRTEINDLEADKQELEAKRRQRERIQRTLRETESEIEDREATVRELEEQHDDLVAAIEELETEVERLETEEYSEILGLHKEANQLEFELGRLQSDLDEIDEEIETIENRLAEREAIETRRSEVQSELEDLRTRIDQIEARAVEQFNDHMDTVLDLLEYANLERIWIERTEHETRNGRQTRLKRSFDMHVIRRAETDNVYEDTINHLSESEREVTGLVFALAGYLVHDVYETMPFMLLDSLEAIDSERIAALIEYFEDYATYLVVALLSEDATALNDHQRVIDI